MNIKNIFGKRYDPHIIDLVEYEKHLLYQREYKLELCPPISIAFKGWEIDWSTAEMEAMRDNREKARAIYDKYRER